MHATIDSKKIPSNAVAALQSAQFFAVYLVVAYLNQGTSQHFCLPAQPLDFYMMKQLHFTAAQTAELLSLLMVPWLIKPLYGLLSDFVPIGKLHKKPYLIAGSLFGSLGYFALAINPRADWILPSLLISATGMAVSTVILVALVTDRSKNNSAASRKYFSIQATAYYVASISAALVGGKLCQMFLPQHALACSAAICGAFCLVACAASCMLREERTTRISSWRNTLRLLRATIAAQRFRSVAAFVFLWNLSPTFGTPLYYYYSTHLHFSQEVIGRMGATNSLGMVAGAITFRWLVKAFPSPRSQAGAAIVAGIASNLSYLFCINEPSALALEFFRGVSQITAILAIYGLAADVCPRRIAATAFGILIAINNFAMQSGSVIGANIFTHLCSGLIQPLALTSAAFTAACFLALPFLSRSPHR